MTSQPNRFATRIAFVGAVTIAAAAAITPADRVLAQDARHDVVADSSAESGIAVKNVPEPSAIVIAGIAAAMEGWSVWKRRRRATHANLMTTGAAGGRWSG